jgi:hypothetical protein
LFSSRFFSSLAILSSHDNTEAFQLKTGVSFQDKVSVCTTVSSIQEDDS